MGADDGPLATLPGYTESDYDPAAFERKTWYCIFETQHISKDRERVERTRCAKDTPIHHDLEHVRRMLHYEWKARRLQPFARHHIYKLVLAEGETLPERTARGWKQRDWRVAGRACPITLVESVELTRAKNMALIEHQIIRGR